MSASDLSTIDTIDLKIQGMDCPSCASVIESALGRLPGVREVTVLVAAARATVRYEAAAVCPEEIRQAVIGAGFQVPSAGKNSAPGAEPRSGALPPWAVLLLVAGVVLVVTLGEHSGAWDRMLAGVPGWAMAGLLLAGGWSAFLGVFRNALRRRITSHALLVTGVLAAAAIGEWTTAAILLLFIRLADWLEGQATRNSREAVRRLIAARPAAARVLRAGAEVEVPVSEVRPGEVVVVRSGERIPVDGTILEGHAPVDQASVTGESFPVDRGPGDSVFAATVAQAGYLQVRAVRVGPDTTFSRIVRLVEEAESQKSPVQRFANRFAAYYLPAVLLIALGTFLATGAVTNAVSVLVVACACAIALATPVVVTASVGCGARQGLLIKGGAALEQLARVDTVVFDKTGTLTRGAPEVTEVVTLDPDRQQEMFRAVAALERRSEHPLGRAVAAWARRNGIAAEDPESFEPLPGRGVLGTLAGRRWAVGNRRLLADRGIVPGPVPEEAARQLETAGKTVFFTVCEDEVVGLIAVADRERAETGAMLKELNRLGIRRFLVLTGDSERAAAGFAGALGLEYRAGLLPEEKIDAIRELQDRGAVVLMVGDGINDAPALARADVGLAIGTTGTAVAVEAADVALLRDDLLLVPDAIRIGREAARTIRQNLGFTAAYNLIGLSLAAVGWLPPIWAAAAHNLPDVAIMLNSGRLLRGSRGRRHEEPAACDRPALSAGAAHAHTHDDGSCHGHGHSHSHSHTHCGADG